MAYYCGIDIGGTFTDCVISDDEGSLTQTKVSTTPDDFTRGFLHAIERGAAELGRTPDELLAETKVLLHGTTIGTNILVQKRGARTGLITTRGHRDAILIMRAAGRSAGLPLEQLLHISRHRKPEPIVPPELIREVTERLDWEGEVVAPLHEEEARAAVEELVTAGVDAIAIAFLWGFVNPSHELRVKEMVQAFAPSVFVTCAHELIRKPGEYERTAATVINAYIGPAASSYINRLRQMTAERGYRNSLLIMQAAGGVMPLADAATAPLYTIGSGPVGGLAGSAYLAEQLGHRNVIATDMGGTSFEVGIVHDGAPLLVSETIVNQYTFFMPRLLIESIGAGGGSIVWYDDVSKTLRVGPESAQAQPGPACYGRGGTRPTLTDANMVLGYFGPDSTLAGDVVLDSAAAERALASVAAPLGLTAVEAAAGARTIGDAAMAGLIRQLTIERGLDPRDFVVYAYGGAGGQHAVSYARELGVSQVVVPLGNLGSCFSAFGVLASDILHLYEHAELISAPFDAARIAAIFAGLEEQALEQMRGEGIDPDRVLLTRSAGMKFSLQIHEVEVDVPAGRLGPRELERQIDRFVERYEATYGAESAFLEAGVQIGWLRVRARARTQTPRLQAAAKTGNVAPPGRRPVYWPERGEWVDTAVYDGRALGADARFEGPAIVEYPATLVAVGDGDRAEVDRFASLVITLADPA